jgi:hypothetical protein
MERFGISSKIGKRKVEEGIQKNEKKCEKGKGRGGDKEKWLRECEALARSLSSVFLFQRIYNSISERGEVSQIFQQQFLTLSINTKNSFGGLSLQE